MKPHLLLRILLLGSLAVLAGCSKRHKIEIQSDTCWSGLVNGDQGISDCGNASYTAVGKLGCVRVTRQTTTGFVRVRIDGRPWAETTPTVNVVQACD